MLKVKEVAKILGVSVRTVYRLIEDKELPSHKFGTTIRVNQSDLDEYLKQSKTV